MTLSDDGTLLAYIGMTNNRRLASACYQANGRHAERDEYASNNGVLKIYSLFEPPPKPKPH
ncbi:hypothetical protein [Roseimaritima ulvae]|uniref:hypothetical protein n=1 Tax=Roseimaritima ulvae TaxID=980254 RepID=UPI00083018E2|nr:hypothetical protein [Roseimaritima ulvae]